MAFLTKEELTTRAHMEIINAITRDNDSIVDSIIGECISYMKGYLASRYDVDKAFAATGVARDLVLLRMLKALVIYEVYCLANPNMVTQTVKDNNEQAVTWLKGVQKSDINPDLPMPPVSSDGDNPKCPIQYGGNTRRRNRY